MSNGADLYPVRMVTYEGDDGLTFKFNKAEMSELIYAVSTQVNVNSKGDPDVLRVVLEKLNVMDKYCSGDKMYALAT